MEYRDKSFASANEACCAPMPAVMPKDTLKDITGNNYKAAHEIDCVLEAIEAQIFGIDVNKHSEPEENTLEAALIGTNRILNSIMGRLHQFADRMGVET